MVAQTNNNKQTPRVGVGVLLFKDGKALLGERIGSHGEGEYSSPGGHLDYMESFEDCARRETLEECGVEIQNVEFSFLANFDEYAPKHYVHIGLVAQWKSGEPRVVEPDKAVSWAWFDLDDLPENIFYATRMGLEAYQKDLTYIDLH